ncbi:MAG: putative metal-binding motif-containing protein [Deltaproteobacteria bacterium]|nr:putative metal-binding motif-containing protein [Deltaproteobacteria bacterium]
MRLLWPLILLVAGCWSSRAIERADGDRTVDPATDVPEGDDPEDDQPYDDADGVAADATDIGRPDLSADAVPEITDDDGSDEAAGLDGGCVADDDCDDCIDCTVDSCDPETGECRHAVDPDYCPPPRFCEPARMGCWPPYCTTDAECDDGDLCNGVERCDTDGLCLSGTRLVCDDGVACTVDTCDPGSGRCTSAPPDRDLDTYPDGACGGTDCDDIAPAVHPGAAEVCNGLDDDCDTATDEDLECLVGATRPCTTWCGTEGTQTCGRACRWGGCQPPPETCNCSDDDCNLLIDETCACERITWRTLSECRPWRWPDVLPAECRRGVIDDAVCWDAFVSGHCTGSPVVDFSRETALVGELDAGCSGCEGTVGISSAEACMGTLTLCVSGSCTGDCDWMVSADVVVVVETAGVNCFGGSPICPGDWRSLP